MTNLFFCRLNGSNTDKTIGAPSQFIAQLQKTNLRSNLATCLLIRYTAALLRDNLASESARPLYQFLEKMLRHKNEVKMPISSNFSRLPHTNFRLSLCAA